jgi:hypothetical protein
MQEQLEKLKQINERWYKGAEMFQSGAFKTPEQLESANRTFSSIVHQALPLWEEIQEKAPELLTGFKLFREPPDDTPITARWIGDTWVPQGMES